MRSRLVVVLVAALGLVTAGCAGDRVGPVPSAPPYLGQSDGIVWPLRTTVWPTFNTAKAPRYSEYEPLNKAKKEWKLCISVASEQAAYYSNIAAGARVQASGERVTTQVVAGGLNVTSLQQAAFTRSCADNADALVLAPVLDDLTAAAYEPLIAHEHQLGKAVIVTSPGLVDAGLTASVSPVTHIASRQLGYWLNADANTKPGQAVILAGPKGSPQIASLVSGLVEGLAGTPPTVVGIYYGPVNPAAQVALVEKALRAHPHAKYVVGLAEGIDAAAQYFKQHPPAHPYVLASLTYTDAIAKDISAGLVAVAIDDRAVAQGAIAVDYAIRILQGATLPAVTAPAAQIIDSTSITYLDETGSLASALPKGE